MFQKKLFFVFTLLAALVWACTPKTAKQIEKPVHPKEPTEWSNTKPDVSEETEEIVLDDIIVKPSEQGRLDSIPYYQASAPKAFDLKHTKIQISFDFAKKHAPAVASLTLSPWFKSTDKLVLDAKNFEIKKVALASGQELKYTYDGMALSINLNKVYTKAEDLTVVIDYVARPDDRNTFGGSDAISSDKGLYFIDPENTDPDKPTQIWTQGETESSSRWFPTIDKPNQRCTQEIYMTVPDKYTTLSNGLKISSQRNADGTRTDYWKMDKPHAPYLFMMAVGEFAKVSDKWRNIPVDYYVEPKFEPYARDIYPYTTEMLEFYSTRLGYPYPWPSFSQIIVRDYVSGAMENTGAVIFGDFIQKDKRSLLDDHWMNEGIVAHEMFHHWFGDLVTCESWANLTLNEGFATYGEYLWLEHKYGRAEADHHLEEGHDGFFGGNEDGGHPPIHYHYGDKEQMFDGVSYAKGGAILHMLRKYLGDEAFFGGLSLYLRKHEYTDVESDELRMAMEEVSGEDLHWFFDQWLLKGGFPILDISYGYDATTKMATVTVEQLQEPVDAKQTYVFDLPLFVDIYQKGGTSKREAMRVTKRKQEFKFAVGEKPLFINFDAEKALLCQKNDQHTQEEWEAIFQYGPLYRDRVEALNMLSSLDNWNNLTLLNSALQDKSRAIRAKALSLLKDPMPETLKKMAATDSDPAVRAAAIKAFGSRVTPNDLPMLRANLAASQPYSVVAAALEVLSGYAPDSAAVFCRDLENETNQDIVASVAKIYQGKADKSSLAWFEKQVKVVDFTGAFTFFEYYQKYLSALNDNTATESGLATWKKIALNEKESSWRRFAATKAMADMRNSYKKQSKLNPDIQARIDAINGSIKEIKSNEKDKTLLMYYEMF
jgi:aminopeptidase N